MRSILLPGQYCVNHSSNSGRDRVYYTFNSIQNQLLGPDGTHSPIGFAYEYMNGSRGENMKGKKRVLAGFLEKSRLLNIIRNIPDNSLTIINYHRIYANKLDTEFDAHVFGPSVTEFEHQMSFLRKHVNLVSEQDIAHLARTGKSFSGRNALVTFDDGYRDNHQLAVPILKKYHIPAIFFIPTDSIEKSMLGWWDIISYFINHTEKEQISFNEQPILLHTRGDREMAKQHLLAYMKSAKHEESKNLLSRLSGLCGVEFPSRSIQEKELMSWDQIKEIASSEHLSIGSHTVSHRVLSTINGEEELKELEDSRKFLQKKLSCEIRSIAYPVGGYHAFSERTKKNAKKAGYHLGFSFNTGSNIENISDPFDIRRVGPEQNLSVYKAGIILPRIFSSMVAPPTFVDLNSHQHKERLNPKLSS